MATLWLLVPLTDKAPEPEDVTAGGAGAIVLVLLALAVVFLGFSLVKQLRKAQAAEDAGLYDHDEKPAADGSDDQVTDDEVADPDADQQSDHESDADNNGEPHRTA
jgi:hypothetical protein